MSEQKRDAAAVREHELKTWPMYFEAVSSGHKRFEIRRHDRDFRIGDVLVLREYDAEQQTYTGRSIRAVVTYITAFPDGLRDGYVCMGIAQATATAPDEVQRLRSALERVRLGYQNILEFRKLTADVWGTRNGYGGRYGALTREEIEGVIAEIDATLNTTPQPAPRISAEALIDAAEELLEVAVLRGDNDLPHPEVDRKPWTARMQSAWDALSLAVTEAREHEATLCETVPGQERVLDAREGAGSDSQEPRRTSSKDDGVLLPVVPDVACGPSQGLAAPRISPEAIAEMRRYINNIMHTPYANHPAHRLICHMEQWAQQPAPAADAEPSTWQCGCDAINGNGKKCWRCGCAMRATPVADRSAWHECVKAEVAEGVYDSAPAADARCSECDGKGQIGGEPPCEVGDPGSAGIPCDACNGTGEQQPDAPAADAEVSDTEMLTWIGSRQFFELTYGYCAECKCQCYAVQSNGAHVQNGRTERADTSHHTSGVDAIRAAMRAESEALPPDQ